MQVKTITTVAGVNEIDFGNDSSQSTAHFYWLKNLGDSTLYVSANPNPIAEKDDVAELPAKGAVSVETDEGKIYILGAGKVEIHRTNSKFCPFDWQSSGSGGGGSSSSISGFQIEKYIDERVIGTVSVSTLPYALTYGTAVVLNNEIHILGGGSDLTNHYKFNGTSWESVSTLPYSFDRGSAVVLNNEIHILGGGTDLTGHYKFNGTSWESVSTLPYGLISGSAVVLNNEIHILGGTRVETNHYKFNGTSWESVSTLPYAFTYGSAVVLNNEIHILGGTPIETGSDTNHYKFNGTSWESVSTLPYAFTYGSAVVLNNEIHILGGLGFETNHYTASPDTRHISALIPKGVYVLFPDIQKIIYASDNVAIEENNVARVTETGYVEIITKLTEFNEAYNGGLVFYW